MPDIEQLRRALAQQAGDPLGLRHDVEASFAIADAAARRFIVVEHSREALDEWRAVVDELIAERVGGDGDRAIARRLARRMLVDACEQWLSSGGHGTPTDYLIRALEIESDERHETTSLGPVLVSLLFDIAWTTRPTASMG